MTEKKHDGEGAVERAEVTRPGCLSPEVDPSLVLVVGRSRINRVVVSRIVERSGFRPMSEPPDVAAKALATLSPRAVILDGGPDNRDCDELIGRLVVMRDRNGERVPSVILLSTHNMDDDAVARLRGIDAVVSKPILPELLQPVVDRLLQRPVG